MLEEETKVDETAPADQAEQKEEVQSEEVKKEEKGEMPSTKEPEFNQEEVISGWKEDRDRLDSLENENFELKKQISELQSKDLDSEAEEEGLSRKS